MKIQNPDVRLQRLMDRLYTALAKEKTWKPRLHLQPKSGHKGDYICPTARNDMVHWLVKLTDQFKFHPETFTLSVSLLDQFLANVKASLRYIKVITLTCFFLASKIQEEDNVIPSTLELISGTGCVCSVAELLRMERLILDKLDWNLSRVTSLDFIHIFHSLLLLLEPQLLTSYSHMTPAHQLSALTAKLKLCLTHHQLVTVRPAVLALSLLSLELEWYTSDWLVHTVMLQRMTKIDSEEVIRFREMITDCLSGCRYKNIIYKYSPEAVNKRVKRKVSESDEDVYDGIKRLYNEEEHDDTQSTHPGACAQPHQSTNPGACAQAPQSTHPGACAQVSQSTHPGACAQVSQSTHPGACAQAPQSTHPCTCAHAPQSTHPGACALAAQAMRTGLDCPSLHVIEAT